MHISVITDEPGAKSEIVGAVTNAIPNARIELFSSIDNILESDPFYFPDMIFVDTDTTGKKTIPLTSAIGKLLPDTHVVFVDDDGKYALEAFKKHVRGYIVRPVTPESVLEEYKVWKLLHSRPSDL